MITLVTSIEPIINALPTLFGVIIGALLTYFFKKIESRDLRQQELRIEKRKCCAEFLGEANRLVIKSMDGKISSASEMSLLAIYFSNMEILCSKDTITAANLLFKYVLSTHGQSLNEPTLKYPDLKASFISFVKNEISIET